MKCSYCGELSPKMGVSLFKTLTGEKVLRPVCTVCTPKHAAGTPTSLLGLTPVDKLIMDVSRMRFVSWDGTVGTPPIVALR